MRLSSGDDAPALLLLSSLREDVHVEFLEAGGDVLLHSRWKTERVSRPDRTTREALRRMSFGPISLRNVLDGAESGAEGRLTAVLTAVQHLVVRSIGLDDTEVPLLSVIPMTPHADLRPHAPAPDQLIRLSRFATLRCAGAGFTLESPLSLFRVTVHRAAAADLLTALSWTATVEELLKTVPLPAAAVTEIVAQLIATGMVVTAEGTGTRFAEDADPVLAGWSPVDLLFHTRSSTGRHDNDFGATFPQFGRSAPEPAVKPAPDGPRFPLPHPDLTEPAGSGPTLTALLEEPHAPVGRAALTIAQLGDLLYRSMRVRSVSLQSDGPVRYEVSDRPGISVSGTRPLEVYISVDRCCGLPRGTFSYDPVRHALTLVNTDEQELSELLLCTQAAAGLCGPPAVVLTLTARFSRATWKFSGQGYAMVLRDSGAALQVLCLVADAIGLTSAPVGTGDIEVGPRMVGLDWRAESPVGQLVLGNA